MRELDAFEAMLSRAGINSYHSHVPAGTAVQVAHGATIVTVWTFDADGKLAGVEGRVAEEVKPCPTT